jgi:hypothetical protein
MDFGAIAELGVTGALIVVVIMLIDFIRKRFRESDKGDRRTPPECPIESSAAMAAIAAQSGAQTKLLTEQTRVLQDVHSDTGRLVEQHKAGANGVEAWKVQPRMMQLQQESRDLLKELVAVVKKNGR